MKTKKIAEKIIESVTYLLEFRKALNEMKSLSVTLSDLAENLPEKEVRDMTDEVKKFNFYLKNLKKKVIK